jgi:hypothetical protein
MKVGTSAGAGASPAFKKYMDGKISSSDYLRESRKQVAKEVRREISESTPKEKAS